MVRNLKILLGLYFIFLLSCAPFIFPDRDTFYYWDWGKHLAFSYLDGPPMIAYMLRFSSILFGNTFFAMSMVAILCGAGICYCIYKMGVLLRNEETGMLAASLWALNPFVVRSFFTYVTYDVPENLFWAVLMYVSIYYIVRREKKFLYLMGVGAGVLLLSKYTGLVLIVAVLIYFVSNREFRCVFKNPHFYIAGILSLLLFSPVLIWNAKYHWVGFSFQLQQHARFGQSILYQNYWMMR